MRQPEVPPWNLQEDKMSLPRSRTCLALLLPLIALLSSGCGGFTIKGPPSATPTPVAFNITWNTSSMNNIHITIDGTDQTSQFSINYAQQTATATMSYPPDGTQHTIAVTGQYYFAGTLNASASSTFQVVIP